MKKTYLLSLKFIGFISQIITVFKKPFLPIKPFLSILLFTFSIISLSAQTTGDYRSVAGGTWQTLSNWQYYNGSAWVTPSGTTPQGWPGQFAGTNNVLITAGNIITIGTSTTPSSNFSTLVFGVLTVSGSLIMYGSNSTINFDIKTSNLVVTAGLSAAAYLELINKSILILPANTSLSVGAHGIKTSTNCNNNQEIQIGSNPYAYCTGGGGSGVFTFAELMDAGGTITTNLSSNTPVCQGGTLNLATGFYGALGANVTLTYTITSGIGTQTPSSLTTSVNPATSTTYTTTSPYSQPVTFTNVNSGTYMITLASSTVKSGITYTNSKTINVVVNPKSTTAVLSGTTAICSGNSTNLSVAIIGGVSPYTVVYSDGTNNFTVNSYTSGSVISVSPTATKTYSLVSVTNTNGCIGTGNSGSATITVNALPATPTITAGGSTTFCSGGSVTLTSSAGTTYLWSTGATTASISPATAGSYTVRITNASGCQSAASTATVVTVNALPNTPVVGTITQPTCTTPTGSVVINNLPASGTWSLTQSGISSAVIIGSGTTTTVSGLSPGNYNFTVSDGSCISGSLPLIINGLQTNTWTVAGGWSLGTPTANQNINFSENYSGAFDIEACSCQVTGSANVTVLSGNTLALTNGLDVVSTALMTFEDSSSLVQTNNVTNTGNVTYYSQTTPIRKYDYTYWSSPVMPLTLGDVSRNLTLSDKYFSYDSSIENWKQESAATSMAKGIGYIIRAPQSFGISAPNLFQALFIGVPNNGDVSVAVTAANSNPGTSWLLGNPYPSAIDADAFITANAGILDGTLYFWSHKTSIQLATNITNGTAGSGIYAYTSDDYASYNLSGGVGTGTDALAILTPIAKDIPTGKIAAGQGFFANAIASGTVNFTNIMRLAGTTRLNGTGTNQQFFKIKNPTNKTNTCIEKNRVWLNLSNGEGAFKQTLVGYIEGATNDNENLFDGFSFDGNQFVDFYSVNQNQNLVIQGRALPFDENDAVPLGFKSTINGNFSINIDHSDGLLTNQAVFIEDKLTATTFNLKNGSYTFNTKAGTFNDRFVLRYVDKTLKTTNFDTTTNEVLVTNKNKQIRIDSSIETIDKIWVYDLLGREVYQKNNVNSQRFYISNLVSSHQTLLVKTLLQNGKISTSKIIF